MSKQNLSTVIAERFLTSPVEILMEIATEIDAEGKYVNDVKVRSTAASNAAPYVHQRLQQTEVIDNTQASREAIEHDVQRILRKYVGAAEDVHFIPVDAGGRRDLIGSVPTAADPRSD